MRELSDHQLNALLSQLGMKPTQTNRDHLRTVLEAMAIYAERNELRGDLWAEFGLDDAAHHVESKAARVRALAARMHLRQESPSPSRYQAELIDDARDLINYAAFAIRHALGRKP